jgi:hypothetical protein
MQVRCERCSTVYEWHDDGVWGKDCPVCGQLAAWLMPTTRREPKQPSPFAVTAPVRADAGKIPISCPPASRNPEGARWETPPYTASAPPSRPKAGHPWPTPPYMETVPPALPDEPPSPLPMPREESLPNVHLLDARFFLPSDAGPRSTVEIEPRPPVAGDTERPHVHPTGGAPPPRSSSRSGWAAFATGAAIAATMMGIYLAKHPAPHETEAPAAQLEQPVGLPPAAAPTSAPEPVPSVEPSPAPPEPAVLAAPVAPKPVVMAKRSEPACCGSAAPRTRGIPGRRGTILRQAIVARCKGEHGRARSLYESLLDASPNDPDALTGLGDVARDEDDWGGAREYYARALRRAPSFLPALLGAADVEWEVGNFSVAQQKYREIADRMPSGSYPPRVTQRASDQRSTPISG